MNTELNDKKNIDLRKIEVSVEKTIILKSHLKLA